jgi:hypothetical protein
MIANRASFALRVASLHASVALAAARSRLSGFFRAGTRQCEVVHLSTQPGFDSLPVCYLQTDGLLGIEHMKQFIALFVAAIVLVVLPTIASADCPKGYVPCGERSQLCCPGK